MTDKKQVSGAYDSCSLTCSQITFVCQKKILTFLFENENGYMLSREAHFSV